MALVRLDTRPRALFGGLLAGDRALRYIFVDEAGTSALEPVTVVVGIIAHADGHLMLAEALVAEVLGAVPHEMREGFVFHATDVWSNQKHRDKWLMTDRLSFLCAMMSIPRRLGMAVSFGSVRRESWTPPANEMPMSVPQYQHFRAFHGCLERADKYIREYGDPREVATVVAEDEKDMRQFLRIITKEKEMRDFPRMLGNKDFLNPTKKDQESGYIRQETERRITRIRPSIHFVVKDEDPLVQIADACAFGLRRFLSKGEHGERFIHAIVGGVPPIDDYRGDENYQTYFWHPDTRGLAQQAFILK